MCSDSGDDNMVEEQGFGALSEEEEGEEEIKAENDNSQTQQTPYQKRNRRMWTQDEMEILQIAL